jgi:hypothetical protein
MRQADWPVFLEWLDVGAITRSPVLQAARFRLHQINAAVDALGEFLSAETENH